MKHFKRIFMLMTIVLLSYSAADATVTIGKGDFYVSIGDYDYLPYMHSGDRLPRVSFYNVMAQYGDWVYIPAFGRVWRPYVYYDWQPYIYGHWIYTRYGPTWVGYEPWAWAAYHYGNWIYTQNYGWVWIPDYQWHPGRVIWAYSYNAIGWSPAPPPGYTYRCGYLCRDRYTFNSGFGSDDYFRFEDYSGYDDYSPYEDYEDYGYDYDRHDNDYDRYDDRYSRDPYYGYGFRYDPYYFDRAYLSIAPRLWVFVPVNYYSYDDYSDIYFDPGYVRYLFERRFIRFNDRGLDRYAIEQIVRQRITEEPVEVLQLETDRQPVRVVITRSEQDRIRLHANKVMKEVIAPAFVEKRKSFKRTNPEQDVNVRRFNKAEKGKPEVETLNEQTVLDDAKRTREKRKAKREQLQREGIQSIERADREGKLETLKKDQQQVEESPKRNPEQDIRKRSDQKQHGNASPEVKLERWKKRETVKFNQWKQKQADQFEKWKKENQGKEEEIRRAESEFKEKMRRAEDDFSRRIKNAEERNKKTGR